MFTVNGNPILTEDMEVLEELKRQLANKGIKRFEKFIVMENDIQFNCPIHSNGQERKPSCGITRVKKGTMKAGTVHCFTCGYTADLPEMVSNCFGYDDKGKHGTDWLIQNFITLTIENRKKIELDLAREHTTKEKKEYITEEELDSYRYYHPYMYKRKMTNEVIELFDVGYDDHFEMKDYKGKIKGVIKAITFPVRDINGNTLYIGRRSVNSKVFHYPRGVEKALYGVYELPKESKEVIVCESFIDAITSYVYGKPAIALLGLGTNNQIEQLKKLPVRKIMLGLDSDSAGNEASKRIKEKLHGHKIITRLELPKGKDINDLTEKEFNNLPESF